METRRREASATESDRLRAVGEALHRRFDGTAGPARVDQELERAAEVYAHASIREYVAILVEREAARHLREQVPDGSRPVTAGGTDAGRRLEHHAGR